MKTKPFTALLDVAVCGLAALFSVGVGLAVRRHQSPPPPPSEMAAIERAPLSLDEFRVAVEDGKTLVIDARDDVLHARGHVPRSFSLPYRRFNARYAQLRSRLETDLARPVVVYCSNIHCGDSTEVKARLQSLGYTNVSVFPGGWEAWKTAGYSEEKSEAAQVLAPWKNPS